MINYSKYCTCRELLQLHLKMQPNGDNWMTLLDIVELIDINYIEAELNQATVKTDFCIDTWKLVNFIG